MQPQLRPILADERVKIVADGQCLSLLHVQPEDSGKYVCVANNSAGSTRIEVTLSVAWPLSVSVQPSHATVDMGNRSVFCFFCQRRIIKISGVSFFVW
jgi:Immunoglobulin I-set domain